MVGAWCFLDHIGPVEHSAGHGLHVGAHPHIGLQTFAWMIEGEITHRDSLGYTQSIPPGEVNPMTAGDGIAHSEDSASQESRRLHAVQLRIALPEAPRRRVPEFQHYPDLPVMSEGGFQVIVLAGSHRGRHAPAYVVQPAEHVVGLHGGDDPHRRTEHRMAAVQQCLVAAYRARTGIDDGLHRESQQIPAEAFLQMAALPLSASCTP